MASSGEAVRPRMITLSVWNAQGDPGLNGVWPSDHDGVVADVDILHDDRRT